MVFDILKSASGDMITRFPAHARALTRNNLQKIPHPVPTKTQTHPKPLAIRLPIRLSGATSERAISAVERLRPR